MTVSKRELERWKKLGDAVGRVFLAAAANQVKITKQFPELSAALDNLNKTIQEIDEQVIKG